MKRILLVCLMTCSLVACSLGSLSPLTPIPVATAVPTVAPAAAALTPEQVLNMKIRLEAKDSHPTVQLQGGQYHNGSSPASPDYADARLDTAHTAFGDLNGDGQADAAVLLAENYGGSGVFVSLVAVLDAGGVPTQGGSVMIDDRPVVNGLTIQERLIVLDARIHGPNDPACCASEPVVQAYGLTQGGLALFAMTSKAPDGTERAIQIESPAPGAQVAAGPLQVKGTYTGAPFENVLGYHVRDAANNTVAAGPVPAFPISGGSGVTFEQTIDLTGLPAGQVIRLDIADLSPADGSTIAMDSLELMIK